MVWINSIGIHLVVDNDDVLEYFEGEPKQMKNISTLKKDLRTSGTLSPLM